MSEDSSEINRRPSPLAALRRFVRPRSAVERCELCSVALAADHQHLVDPRNRQLACACDPCAILFSNREGTRYRRVPRQARFLPDFRMTDDQWESLLIPIGMAFFFRSAPDERVVAIYPSPAGPTESLLDLTSWEDILRDNPVLCKMEPDTEALLVNRIKGVREYYLAPIDECYRLVGLIRANWRGLSGGTEVWAEIGRFFAELKQRARVVAGGSHA